MTASLIDLRRDGLWATTGHHRFSSLFSSPPWIEALARTYDLRFSASARVENGAVLAAIPFCHVQDIRGERVVCLPFSDYCDPLVEDMADWQALVEPILALGLSVSLRCLASSIPARDHRFEIGGHALWHGVDLTLAEDELWARLSASARQNIRKAERSGVVVREGNAPEDVHAFHQMHCQVRKSKYRLLAQPLAFFENLRATFAADDGITVLLAELDDRPIAGILLLSWDDTLYYKFNASVDLGCRPNDLLAWKSILLGKRRNRSRLDFGISDIDQPGLVRYKRKFATEEREVQMLRWRPPAYSNQQGEQVTRVLNHVTQLLTDPSVPDEITRAAGEDLYRFFC
jgi:CelD/BcsL family acetyltransferase involved in cellulose biosynthesis